jgi:hypothetical protein
MDRLRMDRENGQGRRTIRMVFMMIDSADEQSGGMLGRIVRFDREDGLCEDGLFGADRGVGL